MEKLINISNHQYDLEKFNSSSQDLGTFLEKYDLTGVELIRCGNWSQKQISSDLIKGLHLIYYPMWIDLWKNNKKELEKQFGNDDVVKSYYGAKGRNSVVENFKMELQAAEEIGVKYVVFHVGHVEIEHCYDYNFTYDDDEIVDCTIELVNEIFKDYLGNITILFENLWWPGLTMLNRNLLYKLLKGVNYANKGFMLDTAHLINTNINLRSEDDAIDYIIKTIKKLGDLKSYIKGIHFNYSLSGEYVSSKIKEPYNYVTPNNLEDFYKIFGNAYEHICHIDKHQPFTSRNAKKILDLINPEFLVYEFSTSDLKTLEQYIKTQHNALGFN